MDDVPSVNLPGLYSIIPATSKNLQGSKLMFIQLLIREDPRHGKDRHHLNVKLSGTVKPSSLEKFSKKKKLETFKMGIFHPIGKRKINIQNISFLILNLPSKIIPKLGFWTCSEQIRQSETKHFQPAALRFLFAQCLEAWHQTKSTSMC